MAKKNLITTPKGRAVYPRLSTPDTKFNPEGKYKIGLAMSAEDAKPLVEKITKARDEKLAEVKKEKGKAKVKIADLPFTEDEDTGEVTFNFKMTASGVSKKTKEKWERKPAVFGPDLKVLTDAKVGGGSICKVSFELSPFYVPALGVGVSLRLEAVQVLELHEFGGRDGKGYGFEAEEPDEETTSEESGGASDDSEGEDEGDDGSDF